VDDALQIHQTPLELIQVPMTDAKTLADVIKDSLIQFALPIIVNATAKHMMAQQI